MVAEDEIDAIGRVQLAQRLGSGLHVRLAGTLVHKVPDHHHHVRVGGGHLLQVLGKTVPVEGGAHVGVSQESDAQAADSFVGLDGVVGLPDVVGLIPAQGQVAHGEQDGHETGVVPAERPSAHLPDHPEHPVPEQPEHHQVQQADGGIHHPPGQPQHGKRHGHQQSAEQPGQPSSVTGQGVGQAEAVDLAD